MRDDKQFARVQGSTINKPIIHIFSSAGKELATVKVHWKNSVNIMNTHVIGVVVLLDYDNNNINDNSNNKTLLHCILYTNLFLEII